MKFSRETKKKIKKLYKGRDHMELTIGVWHDGESEVVHWGPDHKVVDGPDLTYPVGSICKPVTTALLAKYVSEGKLDLDAPISEYIDGLSKRKYYPSLRKLATHHSGFTSEPYTLLETLPYFIHMNEEGGLFHTNPYNGVPTEEEFLDILKKAKLKDKKYKYSYSNIGMSIVGYIVGQVSGKGFWDGLTEYIQDDLGLSNTFLGNVDLTGYDKKGNPCPCWHWDYGDIIAPAGALNATIPDLLEFGRLQLSGELPYLSMCHEVQASGEKGRNIGLAWQKEADAPVDWHTGSAGAFSCWLGVNFDTNTVVAVGTNYGLVDAEGIGLSIIK